MHPFGRFFLFVLEDPAGQQPSYRTDAHAPDWSPQRAAAWRTWAEQRQGPPEDSEPVVDVDLRPANLQRPLEHGRGRAAPRAAQRQTA